MGDSPTGRGTNGLDQLADQRLLHSHQVAALGKAAFADVLDVFAESTDPFLLEAAMLGGEIAIRLRVARRTFVVIAENIIGEQELGVATAAGAERHQEHLRLRTKEAREIVRHDFEFCRIGTGVLQLFHPAMEFKRLRHGAADRAVAGPRHMAGNQTEMSHHRNPFAGHRLDDAGTGRAVNRAGPEFQRAEPYPDRLLRRRKAVRRGRGKETVRRGGHQQRQSGLRFGTVKAATHQINTRFLRRRGLLRRLHVNVGQAAFALELLEIINGVFFPRSEHGFDGLWIVD